MNIIVTGASGHIGGNLCRDLLRLGHDVSALIHIDDKAVRDLPVRIFRANILDTEGMLPAFRGADAVIHLAAFIALDSKIPRNEVTAINLTGTLNVLECCRKAGVKKIIHFSSIHAMEHKPYEKLMSETSPLVGGMKHIYDYTKAMAETAVVQAATTEGFDAVIMSPTSVVGPFDFKPSMLGRALISLYHRQIPALVTGGYNFVDVRDVCEATVKALEMNFRGEKFILAGHYHSLRDFGNTFAEVSGIPAPAFVCPARLALMFLPIAKPFMKNNGMVLDKSKIEVLINCNRNISIQKATDLLGFNPRPLRESLNDTLEWFRRNHYIR